MKKTIFISVTILFYISVVQAYEPLIGSWTPSGVTCGINGSPPVESKANHSLIAQVKKIQPQQIFHENGHMNLELRLEGTNCFFEKLFLYKVQTDLSKKRVLTLIPLKSTIDCSSLAQSGDTLELEVQTIQKKMPFKITVIIEVEVNSFEIVENQLYQEIVFGARLCEDGNKLFFRYNRD